MYTLTVSKKFTAQHFLIGGDWGPENDLHSHDYVMEIRLFGDKLNEHGYLVDIVQLDSALDVLAERYTGQTLNDLAEFEGLNPSIENFARILCQTMGGHLQAPNLKAIEVRVREDDIAWTGYKQEI